MIKELPKGTYVVAVSGGVDSMALMHMLHDMNVLGGSRSPHRFVVAHFDHGIRPDSAQDRLLVQDAAKRYGLPFVYDQADLGPEASEEAARKARYAFLRRTQQASGARAVITAHHQDDLLETAVHNMLRGTGRRGLISLRSRPDLLRPLLHKTKADLYNYAQDNNVRWREDSTNTDTRYRRNYIRHSIMPRLSDDQRQELLGHITRAHDLHEQLERELTNYLHLNPAVDVLDRHWFIMLPHAVAREVLVAWLRRHGVADVTSATVERLIVAAKTYAPGKRTDVDKKYELHIHKDTLALLLRDR